MHSEKFNQDMKTINRMLHEATPGQAYCLGVACGLAEQDGLRLKEGALLEFQHCETIEQVQELYRRIKDWQEA